MSTENPIKVRSDAMNNRDWVESLYETFMMRDLIGYVGPGSILIVGLLCELEKTQLLKSLISNWSGIVLIVIASYITATGLRLLGTSLRLVMFHRGWGLLGRGRIVDVSDDWKRKLEQILWRQDESWLKKVYARIGEGQRGSIIKREVVFMHLTGLTGMALLVLASAVLFLDHDGLSKLLSISECTILMALILASIVFLLGHYRHTHQKEVLQSLGNGQ